MREIIKLMNADFENVKVFGLNAFIIGFVISFLLALLFSPGMTSMMCLFSCAMILPLMMNDDKGNNHFYGVLPVNRNHITKARFSFIFCVFFISEIVGMILSGISLVLKLNKLLPESIMMKLAADNFDISQYPVFLIVTALVYTAVSVSFMYAEMIKDIFGSDRLGNIIILTLLALFGLFAAFILASSFEIIHFYPHLPDTMTGKIIMILILNAVTAAAGIVFSSVTTSKISGREL